MRWIKVETHLSTKSEILRLALRLGISRHEAVGLCLAFWSWADNETQDGRLVCCTPEMLDGILHYPGLAEALTEVGWLAVDGGDLVIPNFERHNGQSAKRRAAEAKRQAKRRKTY